MALEYFDTFSDYTTAQTTRYFTAGVQGGNVGPQLITSFFDGRYSLSSGNGRNGNSSLRWNSSGEGVIWTGTSQATRAVGFAFKTDRFNTGQMSLVAITDANIIQVALRLNIDGTISVVRALFVGNQGTVLATTTKNLFTNIYYYIEFVTTIHNTTGSYTLNVNGNQWLTATGVNTRQTSNNSGNGVAIGPCYGSNDGIIWDYSDLYINNDGTLYGDSRVELKAPTGNGTTNNFTRGGTDSGANWSQVNDATANDNTNYVLSGSAGDIDLYSYPALSTTAGTVRGVMTVPVLENDTAGPSTVQSVYRSGGTNFFGATGYPSSNNYMALPDIQATDPNTSAPWTVSGVNSAQFGLKRVS